MRIRIEPHRSARFNARVVFPDLPAVCSALGRSLTAVQAGSAPAPAVEFRAARRVAEAEERTVADAFEFRDYDGHASLNTQVVFPRLEQEISDLGIAAVETRSNGRGSPIALRVRLV